MCFSSKEGRIGLTTVMTRVSVQERAKPNETKVEASSEASSLELMYQKRLDAFCAKPRAFTTKSERLFQLCIDRVYHKLASANPLKLKNKRVIVQCKESGFLGDIQRAVLTAEKIKAKYNYQVDLVFQRLTKTVEEIQSRIPSCFKVHFLSKKYEEMQEEFAEFIKSGDPIIGIMQSVSFSGIMTSAGFKRFDEFHHRMVYEAGYGQNLSVKDNTLSMGLDLVNEEGIMFENFSMYPLAKIETPWIKKALGISSSEDEAAYHTTNALYHAHIRTWQPQVAFLCAVAEKENLPRSNVNIRQIDIYLPLEYSLDQLEDWGLLKQIKEHLINCGINKITRITSQGPKTKVLSDKPGKEIRILSDSMSKADMEAIQSNSHPELFGARGCATFSEGVLRNTIPFFIPPSWLIGLFNGWQKMAEEKGLPHIINYLKLFSDLDSGIDEAEKSANKRYGCKRTGWFIGEPSYVLTDPNSIPRQYLQEEKCEVVEKIIAFSKSVATMCTTPELAAQFKEFNSYIHANCNFDHRLFAMVERGVILNNYPELIDLEKALQTQFNEIDLLKVEPSQAFKDKWALKPQDQHYQDALDSEIVLQRKLKCEMELAKIERQLEEGIEKAFAQQIDLSPKDASNDLPPAANSPSEVRPRLVSN